MNANELSWAEITFTDRDEAMETLQTIETELKLVRSLVNDPEVSTSDSLAERLTRLEELEDELCDLLFQDIADFT